MPRKTYTYPQMIGLITGVRFALATASGSESAPPTTSATATSNSVYPTPVRNMSQCRAIRMKSTGDACSLNSDSA